MYTAGFAEELAGFLAGHRHRIDQRGLGMHNTHATTTATTGGLDDYRVTNGAGDLDDFLGIIRQGAVGTRHAGHARSLHGILGRYLIAHQANGFGAGTDEDET